MTQEDRVIDALLEGPLTVRDLAQRTELTVPQVQTAVSRLRARGLVQAAGCVKSETRGAPLICFGLTPEDDLLPFEVEAPVQRAPVTPLAPRQTRIINGQAYEVVWSGKDSLSGSEAPGLGATLSGDGFVLEGLARGGLWR